LKAYEETWELAGSETNETCLKKGHVLGIQVKGKPFDEVVTTDSGVYGPTLERARLIVQAPAMARLLLRLSRQHQALPGIGSSEINDLLRAAGVLP